MQNQNDEIAQMMVEEGGPLPTGIVIQDLFNGSVDSNIVGRTPDAVDNGNTWRAASFGTDNIGIDGGGKAVRTLVDSTLASIGIESGVSDVLVDARMLQTTVSPVADCGIFARANLDDILTDSIWAAYDNDTSLLRLRDRGSGSPVDYSASVNLVENVAFTLTLQIIGTTATARVVQGATDVSIVQTIGNTSFKGCAFNLRGQGSASYSKCNNLTVTGL